MPNPPGPPADADLAPGLDADIAAAQAALEAGEPVTAARHLERHEAALEHHEGLALVWSSLLAAVGNDDVLAKQVRRLSAWWPRHPPIALNCAVAATRWIEPWDPDRRRDPLAGLAADVLLRCIDGRGGLGADDRWGVPLALGLARALCRVGPAADDDALEAFESALSRAPDDSRAWADLARLHQMRRRWAKGLGAAREALRHHPQHAPAQWAAAVCATVLADPGAATHWAALSHQADGADAHGRPQIGGLPPVEVRLTEHTPPPGREPAPDRPAGAELEAIEDLWVQPLSPAHGVVISPTVLDLPADYGDVIAWDPVVHGFRVVGDREVPRFHALAVLERGAWRTVRFISEGRPAVVAELDQQPAGDGRPAGARVYVHTGRTRGAQSTAQTRGKVIVPREASLEAVIGWMSRCTPPLAPDDAPGRR